MALDPITKTLLEPFVRQIIVSQDYPDVLLDQASLNCADKIGKDTLEEIRKEDPYLLMYAAARAVNFSHYIKQFQSTHESGVIVILGAGLNTLASLNAKPGFTFYEVDLPKSINFREEFLTESKDDHHYRTSSYFNDTYIKAITNHEKGPFLILINGISYYFKYDDAIRMFNLFKEFGSYEVVFDVASIRALGAYKEQGKDKFGIDKPEDFLSRLDHKVIANKETKYFSLINPKKIKFSARRKMASSDIYKLIRMEDFVYTKDI